MDYYKFYKNVKRKEYTFSPAAFESGWATGGIGAKELFEEIANDLKVPFFDKCCEHEQQLPVRYNAEDDVLEAYNPANDMFEPIFVQDPNSWTRRTLKFTSFEEPFIFQIPANVLLEKIIVGPLSDCTTGLLQNNDIIVYEEEITAQKGAVWTIDKWLKIITSFSMSGLPIGSTVYVTITNLS